MLAYSGEDRDPDECDGAYDRFRDQVYRDLREGTGLPGRHLFRTWQFLAIPAFANPVSWDILRPPRKASSLYRTCWREDLDAPAFHPSHPRETKPTPFAPTVEVVRVGVPAAVLDECVEAFRRVNIPPGGVDSSGGQDGVFFELMVGNFWGGCRLNWWCDLPQTWAHLHEPIRLASERFEETFRLEQGGSQL